MLFNIGDSVVIINPDLKAEFGVTGVIEGCDYVIDPDHIIYSVRTDENNVLIYVTEHSIVPMTFSESVDTVEKMTEIFEGLMEVYIAKNSDYGDSVRISYDEFGDISCMTRLYDKFLRMKQLVKTDSSPKVDESLNDTIEDAINYLLIWRTLRG